MKQLIENLLEKATKNVLNSLQLPLPEGIQVYVERPRDKTHGDFSSNIAMLLARPLRQSPRQIAEQILAEIPKDEHLDAVSIAGAGFINFRLSDFALHAALHEMSQAKNLIIPVAQKDIVVVDYSSPNLAKEMHVGHLRSTIIGDAIARVLAIKGYTVIRQNHVGDWGTQFGMLLAHLEDQGDTLELSVELGDLEAFYKAAKKRFDEEEGFADRARKMVVKLQAHDPRSYELWKTFIQVSLSHCQEVYQRLGVLLTAADVRAESAYNDDLPTIIDCLAEKKLLVEDEGAKCVFLPEFKGKEGEPLPIIVQKKDGGFLYATTDLAAIRYRSTKLHANRVIYVVDARQALHFQQIFNLAYLAEFTTASVHLEHVGFGMVLDKQGRPFKSREGGVTKLADLLNEAERRASELIAAKNPDMSSVEVAEMAKIVGIASVKYADLSKNRISDYMFDWDSMISFEGNTAPYLMYAYTRIQSLLNKAKGIHSHENRLFKLESPFDRALAQHLLQYREVINTMAEKSTPHLLCTYLYELAGLFSSFYESCPMLILEDVILRESRLNLSSLTAKVLKEGLGLLGIATLERM